MTINEQPGTYVDFIDTPLGLMEVCATNSGLTSILFCEYAQSSNKNALTERARVQLDAYFAGSRQHFDLPLSANGTAFQARVWQALQDIPFGETRSYGEIAAQVGNPKGSRAVGLANGKNPLTIVVPCHRVIGASGALTGYASGVDRKAWLLHHEGALG